ncbi:putative oligopeptide ABC transporter, ATP-binding protein [Mycobacteroides abscessus subsp. abscessus]|nr:putative oligopeptide ABC transporter, ATP-binding protein [Mycobacteroides abscessus subsp. abscessus]
MVDRLADEVAVLRHGVLEELGPRGEILHHPSSAYTRALVAAVPVPDPVEQRARRNGH